MLYTLKNIIFRFWFAIIIGTLITLWILPLVPFSIDLEWILLPAFIILLIVFMTVGWLLNRYGKNIIEHIISDAAILERSGNNSEAEKSYMKAFAIFDSFMFSHSEKNKTSADLISYMARFYMARPQKNYESEAFIIAYLYSHPDDREVAGDWLQRIENRTDIQEEHQDLIFMIGRSQPENMAIQNMLAHLYLSSSRSDFPAQQTYRQVLEAGGEDADKVVDKLSSIFLDEGRADEWALEIYLKAYMDNNKSRLLEGIAACDYWITREGNVNNRSVQEAKKLLVGISKEQLQEMRHGFKPPIVQPITQKRVRSHRIGEAFFREIPRIGGIVYLYIQSGLHFISIQASGSIVFIKRSRQAKLILKWTATLAMAFGLILLVINTIGYLLKIEPVSEKEKVVKAIVTDPFTLQVAAYLKQEHAEKYVVFLKDHKLDAYWTETMGDKRKYYQVRVSHFADKQSARDYGELLKSKGIIDDYYVTNYP